jgi:hypothetical protein
MTQGKTDIFISLDSEALRKLRSQVVRILRFSADGFNYDVFCGFGPYEPGMDVHLAQVCFGGAKQQIFRSNHGAGSLGGCYVHAACFSAFDFRKDAL